MERLTKDWLAKSLSKYENRTQDDHRWGKVEAVNADGSYMVRIGDGEPARCSNGCAANVGDVVFTVVTKDGLCVAMCRLGGDLGGGGSATEQATFYDSSTAIVTETVQGWADVKLNECRAKTDGFDEVATFEDGVLTFLQSGCYEVTANAFWHGMTGQCGIGLWNGDTEEWSAFTSGPTIDSVSIPPVTLMVSAGETRTLKQYVHSGAQTRHSCYAWLTVSYFGTGGTPSGGGGGGGIAEETDPTVPDWAKQPNPPTYTAEDVGALPAGTVIPTVPTKVSEFENDAGYLTSGSMDSIAEYVMSVLRQNGLAPRIDFGSGTLYAAGAAAYYTPVSITDSSVNFYYYGASGVEQILYQITGLTPGCTYRINFSETYTGTFIGDTYQYGCGVLQESEYAATTFPITSGSSSYIKWVAAATPGTQSGSLTFTAKTNKAWWMWYMARLSDGSRQNITFKGTIEVL